MTATIRHGDVIGLLGDPFYPPTPVDCWLEVGGARVNDGSDPAHGGPVVLSGLGLTWGRSTTVDQPDSATVSAEVLDRSGTATFAELAAVGSSVRVWASGTAWDPADTVQTFTDPDWEATTLPSSRVRLAGCTAQLQAIGGQGQVLQVNGRADPAAYPNGRTYSVQLAPADVTGDPDAWDHLPRTQSGQTWTQGIGWGWAAPATVLQVGVIRYSAPGVVASIAWDPVAWDPAAGPYVRQLAISQPGHWLGTAVRTTSWGWTWGNAPWATWADVPPDLTWWDLDTRFRLDATTMVAPAGGLLRSVLVFDGRITDATAAWDESLGGAVVSLAAADLAADLENRDVGAEPWPAETVAARAARIVAASGLAMTLRIDPAIATVMVGRVDVDRQQVWSLLAALATSVDAVCWSAVHATTGPYIWLSAMKSRPAVFRMVQDPDTGYVTVGAGTTADTMLSACDVDLEPVRWVQTTADLATRVVVTWQDQATSPDPTERTVQLTDPAMEAATARYGVRRVSVSSQVTTAAAATAVAESVLYRLSRTSSWRIGGLVYQVTEATPGTAVPTVLDLLDGTIRVGRAIMLTDLPPWSPATPERLPGYLEGGTYDYTDGAWTLTLILSNAQAVGAAATWADLDPTGWTWADMDPALTWADLLGAGPPTIVGST